MDSDKTRLRLLWKARLASAHIAGDNSLDAAIEDWAKNRFDVVLATLPLPDEPHLMGFYQRWLRQGRLALARVATRDFGYVTSLDEPWEVAKGLRGPPTSAPSWEPGPPTLLLIPGLAFAPVSGGVVRLGRGGGYFDRWLAEHRDEVTTLGIGFPFQLTEDLPREPHDILLDGYLDSQGFHGLEPFAK